MPPGAAGGSPPVLVPLLVAVAGYSVGELFAYSCAGALDAAELADLARQRAALMDAASAKPGGLAAWSGLPRERVDALCRDHEAWVAIASGEDAFVIGGEAAALSALSARAAVEGARVTCLAVGVPAHTPLLISAVAPFTRALEHSRLRAPSIPVVAGVDAAWVTDRSVAILHLASQLASTVQWARCLDALFERGCRIFLELGPGSALAAMVRRRFADQAEARSLDDFRSLSGVAAWLARRTAS